MPTNPPTVYAGDVILAVRCPACLARVTFPATIAARLAIDSEHRLLRPQLLAKSTDHRCGGAGPVQGQLPFNAEADDDLDDDDALEDAAAADEAEWNDDLDYSPATGRAAVEDVELPAETAR